MASCFTAAFVVFVIWPLADCSSHALIFCVLFGTLAGALFGLPASGVAFILPADFADSIGAWTGMMWAMSSLFALIGPPIVGELVRLYTIESVGYWTGVNLVVAGGCTKAVMWLKIREEWREMDRQEEESLRTIVSVA